jgi:hypothetical protein
MVGKLERVPLSDVWKHEAHDFTVWLEQNPDVLSDAIGITINDIEREKSAGDFIVDLLGVDISGNMVIIENQLKKSDHDHLGKLLTYLAAVEAKTAIWITSNPRPEHVKAIAWLNDSSSASFYMLKVEAVKIGNSDPAPMLTLIVGPSEESPLIKGTVQELAGKNLLCRQFWAALIARLKEKKVQLHSNLSPGREGWIATSAGLSGLSYNYVIHKGDARVELYIDKYDTDEQNARLLDTLMVNKDKIEADFGETLEWQKLPGRRACRVVKVLENGGLTDEEHWESIIDNMIDAMSRFEKALKPYIEKLKV